MREILELILGWGNKAKGIKSYEERQRSWSLDSTRGQAVVTGLKYRARHTHMFGVRHADG